MYTLYVHMYVPSGKYKILIVGINLDNTGPNSCFETFYLKSNVLCGRPYLSWRTFPIFFRE